MALQGNLRDFSATEILQLVGSQKKSGCLTLDWNTERAVVYVNEGRVVSTRQPGMTKDDPLLAFLMQSHRLSEEQYRGLLAIQKESNRDLEELLLNGRYLDAQELAGFLERQILEDLMRLVRWENGTYRFDPNNKWPHPPVVLISMESAMMEAARRGDEQKRFVQTFKDPHQLLGVRDLPDPDEPLAEEEREMFGIIDGLHTVAEVVEAAPLSEYEAYESLQRMLEAKWIEVVGRRDPGAPALTVVPERTERSRQSPARELAVVAAVLVVMLGLRFLSGQVDGSATPAVGTDDVFAVAQVRDLRFALDLYRRERGSYPQRLDDLIEDRWVSRDQVQLRGYQVIYRQERGGEDYQLEVHVGD